MVNFIQSYITAFSLLKVAKFEIWYYCINLIVRMHQMLADLSFLHATERKINIYST
jgi:hypothetical protein